MKYLEILESQDDRRLFQAMADLMERFHSGITPIQIEHFVLNDVEFPTEYGKFEQVKAELVKRYGEIVFLYYEIKKAVIRAQLKGEEAESERHPLKRSLLELEKEEEEFKAQSARNRLRSILCEARTFIGIYDKHKAFDALPEAEREKLEAKQWAAKALNMPDVFEQRYGRDFMIKAIGEARYEAFLERRRRLLGVLPRELLDALPELEANLGRRIEGG